MDEAPRCYRHPDRETYVSCSECGRPICEECMSYAPVGLRCPEHSTMGATSTAGRTVRRTTGSLEARHGAFVTKGLIALSVLVYAVQLAAGAPVNANAGWIYEHGVLVIRAIDSSGQLVGLAEGEWWRLLTAAFLHYGFVHLFMNMLLLWFIGQALEAYLGHLRFGLLYLVAGLAGSAGALLWTPNAATVGASGAIWGVMGAALVLELRRINVFGGSALTLVVLNLVITFAIPGISKGGHLGGLVGGALAMLAFHHLRRVRPLAVAPAAVVLVGVASVVVAVLRVRGYA